MTLPPIRVSREWLALREPADAASRALDLVEHLRAHVRPTGGWVIHDLGCGTGSMGRWLAPLLPGRQLWVGHDHDPDLLTLALTRRPRAAADGAGVTLEARRADITRLPRAALAGATLITASALLDVLTEAECNRVIEACVAARCPTLLTLSVVGRVGLTPADPSDRRWAAAFDAHQRRTVARGRLLGPDAVAVAVEQFERRGAEVLVRASPWRLGPAQAELASAWLTGWVAAACEQQVDLADQAAGYARRRLAQAGAGRLEVTVDHADLLVLPRV